jgi:hypothetical protein
MLVDPDPQRGGEAGRPAALWLSGANFIQNKGVSVAIDQEKLANIYERMHSTCDLAEKDRLAGELLELVFSGPRKEAGGEND